MFSTGEACIVAQLGELPTGRAPLSPREAKERLEVLFWAERQTEELRHRRERNQMAERRERRRDRRIAATEWLQVGRDASRLAATIAILIIVVLALATLYAAGQFDPSPLLRLLPGA